MACASCGRGFHSLCFKKGGCKKCHSDEEEPLSLTTVLVDSPVARKKNEHNLKDEKSTGRKRAARLYPLDETKDCEWKLKKNCGGGRRPVIGCLDGKQKHRHHGPVKRTTRNEEGNVHRICTACHVHWHELNDLVYDEADYSLLKHNPDEATDVECARNQIAWSSGEVGRQFQLASSAKGKNFVKKIEEEEDDDTVVTDADEGS